MATTDQRSRKTTGPKGNRRAGPTAEVDTAQSLTEAISLLESFVSSLEPGRYSGDDAALLVERFSRGEHLCATGEALAANRVRALGGRTS
jgi:hypothetical protein